MWYGRQAKGERNHCFRDSSIRTPIFHERDQAFVCSEKEPNLIAPPCATVEAIQVNAELGLLNCVQSFDFQSPLLGSPLCVTQVADQDERRPVVRFPYRQFPMSMNGDQ